MTEKMERANRVSIQVLEDSTFEAKFWRTHKLINTINSVETRYIPDANHNKTMQRELFRAWVCENASTFNVVWDASDRRIDTNKRIRKYDNDTILMEDAVELIRGDVEKFMASCNDDMGGKLVLTSLDAEEVIPMTKSSKGNSLEKLNIIDGKYTNGNWAWATVKVVAIVTYDEQETYITFECQLISGQLKKPINIDGAGYTQTSFKNAILKDIKINNTQEDCTNTGDNSNGVSPEGDNE